MNIPSIFFRLIVLSILVILSTTSLSHAQRIYDGSGRYIGRVDNNRYYDGSGRFIGKVDNDRIYDGSGRFIGRAEGLEKKEIVLFFYFYK